MNTEKTDNLEGLFCPTCEYPLTGLPENRCPECGREFNPEYLRSVTSHIPNIVVRWERSRGMINQLVSYPYACLEMLKDPIATIRGIPIDHVSTQLLCFGFLNRVFSAALLILFSVVVDTWLVSYAITISIGVAFSSYVADVLIALCCSILYRSKNICPTNGFLDWFRILQLSSFAIPIVLFLVLMAILVMTWGITAAPLFLVAFFCSGYWWLLTTGIIEVRCVNRTNTFITLLVLVPFCTLLATAAGIVLVHLYLT